MSETNLLIAPSRGSLAQHEELDAYWAAETLRCAALHVAAEARCMSTVGRRLGTALGRVIRGIVEAADEAPERAHARVARARNAMGLVLSYFNELFLTRGIRDAVLTDLRERAALLIARLDMLQGTPVHTWRASNCVPTVLAEVQQQSGDEPQVDVVAAAVKVPIAAARKLPRPVLREDYVPNQPTSWQGEAASGSEVRLE